MTDLFHVVPHFNTKPFSHILPSLDKNLVTSCDLLTLEALDVAKRAQVPVAEVCKLQDALLVELHAQLCFKHGDDAQPEVDTAEETRRVKHEWSSISTLDDGLDTLLGGGIPAGYLTEITGESGAGKTQTLLTLLLSAQLPPPHGLSRSSIYISTEASLSTSRLSQLLNSHPYFNSLPPSERPTLSRILSIKTPDLESQDHILRYQLPVAIQRHNIGLVVLDSVAANYRAEFDKPSNGAGGSGGSSAAHAMATRSAQLIQLGALLRGIARRENVAVVVANQVADRFDRQDRAPSGNASRNTSYNSQASMTKSTGGRADVAGHNTPRAGTPRVGTPRTGTPTPISLATADPMSLDHQQRWLTGWGDTRPEHPDHHQEGLKTPALGLVWTNQLACRIALIKEPEFAAPPDIFAMLARGDHLNAEEDGESAATREREIVRWRRWMKVVFAPWTAPTSGRGLEFRITAEGLKT
ncbi:P-loop containing nucleoside triphosphate hydrolase protein [Pseudovirgaria hyperparasitica]|uniref:P-loop containing nucleoside triphosphate hydrolase protein n=1 Tax=Pseudovirgaria hyperparasitica TaxID=470096 RepID=A0A6A6VYU9_9PEZI|nr:P-loop containing nucleoside triphosphate hydrolase protein [Pseudovirgaria hyperparasitica]KAF2754487.1 P-loop containing nucleoside triphosphate hydrolase protein [Pseudovirgaria hyperparasitica]